MSRVTVTDLVDGNPSAATDINTTLTSWNNATAAGSIAANNVRDEGLERRNLAQHSVHVQAGSNDVFAQGLGAVIVAPVAATALTDGGSAVRIGPITIDSAGDRFIVRYAVSASGNNNATLYTELYASTDDITYNAIGGQVTRRTKFMRAAGANPVVYGSFACAHMFSTLGTWYFRVYVLASAGNFTSYTAALAVETVTE